MTKIKSQLAQILNNPDNQEDLKRILNTNDQRLRSETLRLQASAARIDQILDHFQPETAEVIPEPEKVPETAPDEVTEEQEDEETTQEE